MPSTAIPGTGWAVMPYGAQRSASRTSPRFELKAPIKFDGGTVLTFTLDQQYPDGKHLLGKFRISVTNAKPPLMLNGPPQNIAAIVAHCSRPAHRRATDRAGEILPLDGRRAGSA